MTAVLQVVVVEAAAAELQVEAVCPQVRIAAAEAGFTLPIAAIVAEETGEEEVINPLAWTAVDVEGAAIKLWYHSSRQ